MTSFDLSCEGEFEISLAQGNFQKEGRGEVEGCRVGKKGYNEEKGRGMGHCNGKGNYMKGKGKAYRFIDGGRGGKGWREDQGIQGMGKKRQGKKERQIGRERKRESKDEGERKRIKEKGIGKGECEGKYKGNRESEVKKEEKKGEWKGKDKDVARGKRKGR